MMQLSMMCVVDYVIVTTLSRVNQQDRVSLRQTLKSSATGGQGFVKCDCADRKNKCGTNRCKCFKNKRICNSRCHNSTTCNKQDGYRQLNVRQLGSLRPWDHRGKCYMDRKRIQCLSNASQHVPIYLQPFLRYSGISVASEWFSTVLVNE